MKINGNDSESDPNTGKNDLEKSSPYETAVGSRQPPLSFLDWTAFGHVVKQLRTQRGWKQERLAERSNLASSYISQIEKGRKSNLSYDSINSIAIALDVEPSWLILLTLTDHASDNYISQLQSELRDEIEMRLKVTTRKNAN